MSRRHDSEFTKSIFRGWNLEKCVRVAKAVEFFARCPQANRGQLEQAGKSVLATVTLFSGVGSFPNFRGRRIGQEYVYELLTTPASFMPELEEVIREHKSRR